MRCPTLNDLPSPPADKTGWPWTNETPQLPETMPNGSRWPRISIVTPSYNQGRFIEETIRSVLLQGYPDLEYVIVDGGSTDDSVDVIQRYAPWLTAWVSEPDRGQAHAINKGLAKCAGELLGWINSDDLLLRGAANHLGTAYKRFPRAILAGDVIDFHLSVGQRTLLQQRDITFDAIVEPWRHNIRWHQPGIFFSCSLYQQAGPLDESLHYVFDRDWLCRAVQIATVHYIHIPVAQFRFHHTSKTVQSGALDWFSEESAVTMRYWDKTTGFDPRLARAGLKLHQAAAHLRVGKWTRATGLSHLSQAVRSDWRVFKFRSFWLLCLKALMPVRLLKVMRRLYLRFSGESLWLNY
jgi:glycosyltransferase involved in cell wall biosynthesis